MATYREGSVLRAMFTCALCGMQFHSYEPYNQHMMTVHSQANLLPDDGHSSDMPINAIIRPRTTEEIIEFILVEILGLKQRIAALEAENELIKAGK